MALTLVTGPPGTGKTWCSIRSHLAALQAGKYVATNVKLHDGWAYEMAKQNYLTWLKGGKEAVLAKAREYERKTFTSGNLSELFALRLPPCEKCKACKAGRNCQTEKRGLMILDEAHEWLNARMWDVDDSGGKLSRDQAVQNRLRVVKFFALHRKLGWDVYLITQSEKRLDNQVRDNFEYHTHLKNMKNYRVLGLVPIVPFNLFIAITFWHASGGERCGVSSYLLSKLANCYDTMARPEISHDAPEKGVIRLPLSEDEMVARAAGTWRPPWLVNEETPVGAAITGVSEGVGLDV